MNSDGLLLDTCAIIFSSQDQYLEAGAASQIDGASAAGRLFVSPISAWEIGRSAASRKLALVTDPLSYFTQFVDRMSAIICNMGPELLVASSFLPGPIHKDPFDRILVETARRENLILVTSDRAILAYSRAGHVKTLVC